MRPVRMFVNAETASITRILPFWRWIRRGSIPRGAWEKLFAGRERRRDYLVSADKLLLMSQRVEVCSGTLEPSDADLDREFLRNVKFVESIGRLDCLERRHRPSCRAQSQK